MISEALEGSKGAALATELGRLMSILSELSPEEVRKISQVNIEICDLLGEMLDRDTVTKIQHALVNQLNLSRGLFDPVLREIGLADTYTRLSAHETGYLLDTFSSPGDTEITSKTAQLLDRLFHRAAEARKERKRGIFKYQVEVAERNGRPEEIDSLKERLGEQLHRQLVGYEIFTLYELWMQSTTGRLQILPGIQSEAHRVISKIFTEFGLSR